MSSLYPTNTVGAACKIIDVNAAAVDHTSLEVLLVCKDCGLATISVYQDLIRGSKAKKCMIANLSFVSYAS